MSNPNETWYSIEAPDFMDHQDCGPWRSYDLQAEGRSVDELIESAVYWQIDQDGGSLGDIPADDNRAVEFILNWCKERGVPAELSKEPESEVREASHYINRNAFDPEG